MRRRSLTAWTPLTLLKVLVRPRWFLMLLILVHVAKMRGSTIATVTSEPIAMITEAEHALPSGEQSTVSQPAEVSSTPPDEAGLSTAAAPAEVDEEDEEPVSILYEISDKLFLYAIPVITLVGLCGNTLVLIVMRTHSFVKSPVSVFLAALSCADTTVLLLDFLNNWVEVVFKVNFLDSMEWFCKAHRFLFDVCYTYSAWLVAGVAIERCIAVWLPFHAKRFCTVKTSKIVVIVMPVVLSVIYFHDLFGWVTKNGRCDIRDDFLHFQANYGPWVSAVIYSWVPITILIASNTALVVKLAQSQKNRKSMGAEKIETLRITVTVVVICVSFTLLTVPLTLFYIVLFAKQMFNAPSPSMAMGRTMVLILGLSNHAINFVFYGLSLPKFRMEVRRLFCSWGGETPASSARDQASSSGQAGLDSAGTATTGASSSTLSTTNSGSNAGISTTP